MATIHAIPFGKTSCGATCSLFTLENNQGIQARITNYGATLVALNCFDRHGELDNICLSYNSLKEYEKQQLYVGGVVGRYANRIRGGQFQYKGQHYSLRCNQGEDILHGGDSTFAYRPWQVLKAELVDGIPTLVLGLSSAIEEGGFPGALDVRCTFALYEDNRLRLNMQATSDCATPVSLTQHGYFNLAGKAHMLSQGGLQDHEFQIHSDKIIQVDTKLLPTGKYQTVEHTRFDFRDFSSINPHLFPLASELEASRGFDNNYCFEPWPRQSLIHHADVGAHDSGRTLAIYSSLPGMQFYTGNYLDYEGLVPYNAFCMEPQFYPDSPNQPHFPFVWTTPEMPYEHTIEWHVGNDFPAS